jgi:ATP-dependent exoDNAse (exonuclease V) beta subunit
MIIANANYDVIPFKRAFQGVTDELLKKDLEIAECSLLYVASTRAKKALIVTCSGRISQFLE